MWLGRQAALPWKYDSQLDFITAEALDLAWFKLEGVKKMLWLHYSSSVKAGDLQYGIPMS